jgi:trehalose 6-phosphate synthase
VRRLGALALTIALAWLVAGQLSQSGASSAALALGVALIAAAIVGWLFEFVRLPRITGYLAFGLICGPGVANIIQESMARDLQIANGLAIAVIGFIAGLELNFARLRPRLNRIMTIGGVTITVAWLGLLAAIYAAWPWLPIGPELAGRERLAAAALAATILVGFSTTVTIAVITESRARGPLAELAVPLVVLADFAVILLYVACMEICRAVFGAQDRPPLFFVASAAWEILGSLAFGAIVGSLFALYLRLVGRELTLVLIALCVIVSALAGQWHFEPLLAAVAAGVVVQNATASAGDVLRDAIERGAMPILVLFFAAAGASIHLEALATVGVAAVAISIVRLVFVRWGSRLGARAAGVDSAESRLLWRALMTKAGVALGLGVLAAAEFPTWGARLQTLVVAVIALHDVIGPILFKSALNQAKEIGRAGAGLVVVSNREPWVHDYAADRSIQVRPTPGGVSVALDALMRERGGVWIAHGAGTADRVVVDARSSIEMPPDAPAYRLRRVWLTPPEEEGYYAGFSNSALWPLCHQAHVKPVFKQEDWDAYRTINRRFADVTAVEAPVDASVFLNDYHLALVAQELRKRRPLLRTALFWHIPWPDTDRLRICPWRKEILEGLLSNDLLAFQVPRDQKNFLAAASEELGLPVSGEVVHFGDRPVRVVAIPIGADFDRIEKLLASEQLADDMRRLAEELRIKDERDERGEGPIIGIGVDRLDYTKGIPERIAAIDHLLDRRADLRDRLVFVQIGVPSRSDVQAYVDISQEIEAQIAAVNTKYGRGPDDGPIRYVTKSLTLPDLVALYRLARFCIVSSLHDGMNLVAKEFVAARDDSDGVLILSELAGAAHELSEALIINPYEERGFMAAIERAIEMPIWERRRRMQALRRRVAGRDVLAWASDILDRLERGRSPGFLSG